jgi:hypothetical protein
MKYIHYDGLCSKCNKYPVTKYKSAGLCQRCYSVVNGHNKHDSTDLSWKRSLKNLYNISSEEYYEMLSQQNNQCKLCEITSEQYGRHFSVDHDHSCCPGNKSCGMCVRGLLCNPCNMLLGVYEKSSDFFEKAAQYLRGEL